MPEFNWKPLLVACLIVSVGQLGLGLVFPLLPWISHDLTLSSEQSQLLVAVYLAGFGPSQLIYGAISDVIGRRPVLLLGVLITFFGVGLVVIGSDSLTGLLIGRFIQGLGAGSASVLGKATIRDNYQNQRFAKAMNWLAIVAAFTPIMAPVLSGILNHYFGWRTVFILLAAYIGLIWFFLVFGFRESLNHPKQPVSVKRLAANYVYLFKHKHFLTFAGIGWTNFAMIILAISLMPYIMQIQIGMSSEAYAWWAMAPACGLLFGGILCQRLRPTLGTGRMLQVAPYMQIASAALYILAPVDPIWMSAAHFMLAVTNGIAFPCAQAMLLTPFEEKSGTVSALSGACQMLFAAMSSYILLKLGVALPWHLGSVIVVASLISMYLIRTGIRSDSGQEALEELSRP